MPKIGRCILSLQMMATVELLLLSSLRVITDFSSFITELIVTKMDKHESNQNKETPHILTVQNLKRIATCNAHDKASIVTSRNEKAKLRMP